MEAIILSETDGAITANILGSRVYVTSALGNREFDLQANVKGIQQRHQINYAIRETAKIHGIDISDRTVMFLKKNDNESKSSRSD